jgi:uncharacterized protein YndB with AHSA1/START domain
MELKFPKAITADINIKAPVDKVFNAWTTREGIISFFAPDANIRLEVMGPYEMIFIPDNPIGSRGGEGNIILSYQKDKMLSFTWNAPPELIEVRNERTHVFLSFIPESDSETRLLFHQDGWGDSSEWKRAFEYFEHAWNNVVLKRLQYRFEVGPVDWKNPPQFK